MYGLLLDSIQKFLREKYGEHYWIVIRRRAKLKNHWFMTHEVYSDTVMTDLIDAAASTLGEDRDYVMQLFGEYFVKNIGRYGYARLLRVLGRDMRDFLNGLDDLHEYLRFSYPKIKPPSFFCENETPSGMVMHYRTKRRGYLPYVIGQLRAIGKVYKKIMEIEVLAENVTIEGSHFVLDLKFDNHEMMRQKQPSADTPYLQISSPVFLSIFPFCILFNQDLEISVVGNKMSEVLPFLVGCRLNRVFELNRPQVEDFNWESIWMHQNCIFELISVDPVSLPKSGQMVNGGDTPILDDLEEPPCLKLKGQMLLLHVGEDESQMIFLCSPMLNSPEELFHTGIFINDMAMHDSSREYVLAGSQQHPELSLALNQEKIRSKQLEDSIQKTDQLLYQMIPKPIADKLCNGDNTLNTCQVWSSVSILFSDIVSFTPMCGRLRPMEVVCVLNAMYVSFDHLCEEHHVYKVQTIGDGYMALSGAPIETPHHAEYMTDFAFSIIEAIAKIHDPSTQEPLRIRVGIHSGTVVGGVVGSSILRYDVFGDSVNVASRMEATGMPMKIHISQTTADLLEGTDFVVQKRDGEVTLKGKGPMQTYWVLEKKRAETGEILNPLQKNKLSRGPMKHHSIIPADVADIEAVQRQRFMSQPNIKSKYELEAAQRPTGRRSISPSPNKQKKINPNDWPAMDGCEKESNNFTGSEVDLSDIQSLLAPPPPSSPADTPNDLRDFACRNVESLKRFASIAEGSAQQARKMADMAKYLVTLTETDVKLESEIREIDLAVGQSTPIDHTSTSDVSRDASPCPVQHNATTDLPLACPIEHNSSHHDNSIGSSVDQCCHDNDNKVTPMGPTCIIL